jgi:hypothetical protein
VLCAVCRRPARGFGWFDPVRSKASLTSHWFCSVSCQRLWSRRAGRSPAMVDLTELERAAIRAALKPVAEIMAEIGWLTRLCELSEAQVLTLIELAVGRFQDAMHLAAQPDVPEVPFP